MSDFDLLSAVQPTGGWYAVVGIKDGAGVKQTFVETREEVEEVAGRLLENQYNVFFGVAKYATNRGRKQDNVQALQALWVDLDCGAGKPYADQNEAMAALKEFCGTIGLPKPIIVNSGRGLHVYWSLEEAVSRAEWEPVAARLKELCDIHSLHADPSCFEAARVLRLPGTYNFKGDEPLGVSVVVESKKRTKLEDLKSLLGVKEKPIAHDFARRELSPLAQQLQASIQSSFSKIMRRGEKGCAQLNACYAERAELSEPRWFDALSVAKFCKDRDVAIHKLSADYPGYDPAEVDRKVQHILGPHTCAAFDKNNPGLCDECPHKGKFRSPIALGREVEAASEEDNNVSVSGDNGELLGEYRIPEYPFPYFRGKGGGIWKKGTGEEAEDFLVYEHDLYLVKRMEDPNLGAVVLMRLHLPCDGVKEVVVPSAKINDGTELRGILGFLDVVATKKQFDLLVDFIIRSLKTLQHKRSAEQMRNQFGWADGDSRFIIGDREISADGTRASPPSSVTSAIAPHMQTVGTFEKWKEVFDMYGLPGLEANAFAAATAFGAPLLKFSGQKGAIINLIHPNSGTGKTTILHMCNSVWGNPDALCAKKDDTFNSKVHKLGVLRNLPVCFDEMSNTEGKQLSELAYLITQGIGKDRMKASSNELRVNNTTWQTIALCSSNHSFYEKLEDLKDSPQGEMMRIIELYLDYSDAIETGVAKHMFDHQLKENYGHAGDIYARFLVENHEEVKTTYLNMQGIIDRRLNLTQRERFWSATAAANLTGIHIAIRLGLCKWDLERIYKWVCKQILELRTTTLPPLDGAQQILAEFILRHIDNTLVINDEVDLRSGMRSFALLEPRRDLKIRFEPDTQKVFILASAFRRECQLRNASYRETTKELKNKGLLFPKSENKRLSKGTKIGTPTVATLVFDASHSEFIDITELVANEREPVDESVGD